MSTTLIEIRRAKASDAVDVAGTHDEAWRAAYQGIIPGNELDKLINRRGPDWWDSAIRKGSRITILQFGDRIAGYANYGRNRARSLFYDGEVYELYLRPEFQGLGFGRRLFTAARKDLVQSGLKSLVVWALSDNEPAMEFYRALGGRAVARSSEKFGAKTLDKVAYAWQQSCEYFFPGIFKTISESTSGGDQIFGARQPVSSAPAARSARRPRAGC